MPIYHIETVGYKRQICAILLRKFEKIKMDFAMCSGKIEKNMICFFNQ
jgi:hypothetical protein